MLRKSQSGGLPVAGEVEAPHTARPIPLRPLPKGATSSVPLARGEGGVVQDQPSFVERPAWCEPVGTPSGGDNVRMIPRFVLVLTENWTMLPGALPVSYTHLTLPTNREV